MNVTAAKGQSATTSSQSSAIAPRTFTPDSVTIGKVTRVMTDEVKGVGKFAGHGDTPAIDIVAPGSTLRALDNHLMNSGTSFVGPCRYEVATMPADGMLDLNLLAPVSGHCGLQNATEWAGKGPNGAADANEWAVLVTLPDGTTYQTEGVATDYVSNIPLSIPLKAGTTKIQYWPKDSGGIAGYESGRTVTITTPKAVAAVTPPSTQAVQAAARAVGTSAASSVAARSNVQTSPLATMANQTGVDTSHLRKVNPNFDRIVTDNPGVAKFLQKNSAAVYSGALPAGEAETPVDWTIWNHSEATGKGVGGYPAYNHGMKDDDLLNKDVVIVWQQPKAGKNQTFDLHGQKAKGEIIGVYQLRDLVSGGRWADGGFNGRMKVVGHGKAGEQTVMAWATVSIAADGSINGGGFPDMAGGVPVPYQEMQRQKRIASGAQYEGRAAEIIHGQNGHVGLVDMGH